MNLLEKVKSVFGFTPAQEPKVTTSPQNPDEQNESGPVSPKSMPAEPPPAAQLREQIIRFIIGKLRAYQNEPDSAPVGLRLFILCASPEEKELHRIALWASQPMKFQAELTRQLIDNYITLPKNWQFDYTFYTDELPESTYREGNLGLVVVDTSKPDNSPLVARVVALVGQMEQEEYVLNSAQKTTFCIGRGHVVQTASGRVRTNDIVLLNDDDAGFDPEKGAGNGAVSRAHATICYDMSLKRYALLVDPGGLPAGGNKTKIIHPNDAIERADIGVIRYPLQSGDQIELGGEVTLLFELI